MKYTGRELTHKMCNSCINNSKQWTSEEAMGMHIPNASCETSTNYHNTNQCPTNYDADPDTYQQWPLPWLLLPSSSVHL